MSKTIRLNDRELEVIHFALFTLSILDSSEALRHAFTFRNPTPLEKEEEELLSRNQMECWHVRVIDNPTSIECMQVFEQIMKEV